MEDKSDTEGKEEKDDKQGFVVSKEELQNIEKDVLEIEKEILNEASNIVSISSSSTTDQTMFLQPFDDSKETEDELLDEAAKVIELLTYDDGQELEQELEQSVLCLEKMMPRTQSEVELDDTEEESDSENRDDVASEESFARSDMDNLLNKRRILVNLSGGSTDSEIDLNLGGSLKNMLQMKPEREESPETTDSEVPLTDSELAFTDSDVMYTDSEIATADVQVTTSELGVDSPKGIIEVNNTNESMESDINIACLNIGNHEEALETEQSAADLGYSSKTLWEESEIDIEIIDIDSSELSAFVSESSQPICPSRDQNIKFENLTKTAVSAEFVGSSKGGEATLGDSQASHCTSQASSCISELSLSSSGATQLQLQQNLEQKIDQKESSSESFDEFVQLGHSESSGSGHSHRHRKCPDISTLDDEVEIVGNFSIDNQENIMQQHEADETLIDHKTAVEKVDEMLPEEKVEECLEICCDFIVESKKMIDESSVVVDNTAIEEEEVKNNAISKEIINGYLYPETEVVKDESADEGWGDDILLDDLEVTGDTYPNNEDDIVEQRDIGGDIEQTGELQEWLEMKEKEFDMILGTDQEPPDKYCSDLENGVSGSSEDHIDEDHEEYEVEEVNMQAEKILFVSSDDIALESNDDEDNIAKPLEVIDEQMVFNPTEDQILDSNSLLITPMVVTPKVKRKKGSKTPKNPRKNIKSPLLRRKEIRTCISLHNACETSDVLQELMRPAISYGSNLNLVEAVENTTENLALEEVKPAALDQPKLNKVKKSVSS